jgi:hypothetical protein
VPLALPSVAYFWKKWRADRGGTAPRLCTCSAHRLPSPGFGADADHRPPSGDASTAFFIRLASSE